MISKNLLARTLQIAAVALFSATTGAASAATLNIADTPLFLNSVVAPLNMLVVGRDHKMFYEAYADHSDLDGDGTLDVGYQGYVLKADGTFKINYFGYFDSFKCYAYNSGVFVPQSTNTNKRCTGQWSGDWLNWVTTARIDALRKVLYGGKRSTDDTNGNTILERTIIPQDAHSWGKEYMSVANDGYDIAWATPYTVPTAGSRHFFASVTLMLTNSWTTNTSDPLLRVLLNQPSPRRIWNWVSKESPDAGGTMDIGSGNFTVTPTDLSVRVQVCVPNFPESNCKQYPNGKWKPTGLLQDFGENDTMLFGLLTGSYTKSKSGGVLRKQMGTIKDEINSDTDGTFKPLVGIIRTMDQLRPAGYVNYTTQAGGQGTMYQPGLVATRPFDEGEFGGSWGNPVGEMMYEALRYFAGKSGPDQRIQLLSARNRRHCAPEPAQDRRLDGSVSRRPAELRQAIRNRDERRQYFLRFGPGSGFVLQRLLGRSAGAERLDRGRHHLEQRIRRLGSVLHRTIQGPSTTARPHPRPSAVSLRFADCPPRNRPSKAVTTLRAWPTMV